MAWMDAVHRLYPKGNLSHCGKRKLELKYFSFVDITKECVLNYKYNNCNLGQFCYLASSGQVSFAFPMKSWHLMSENSQKMSVNYSEKNIASTKADNRNFKTITWKKPVISAYSGLGNVFSACPYSHWFQWEFRTYREQERLPIFSVVAKPALWPVRSYHWCPDPKSHSPGHKSWAEHECSKCHRNISDYPRLWITAGISAIF